MERKDYKCPDCKTDLIPSLSNGESGFHCMQCQGWYSIDTLIKIDELMKQIHQMRNCENCGDSLDDYGRVFCLRDNVAQNDCLNNDRKYWFFSGKV